MVKVSRFIIAKMTYKEKFKTANTNEQGIPPILFSYISAFTASKHKFSSLTMSAIDHSFRITLFISKD